MKWCIDNSIMAHIPSIDSIQTLAAALLQAFEHNAMESASAEKQQSYDILLAEDNIVNQKVAVKILEKMGHSTDLVENGQQALNAVKSRYKEGKPYDVILMDVSMPFMGGIEATEHIRKWEADVRAPRIPIVALTAHAMLGDRERCLRCGMDEYVPKPLRKQDLIAAIAKAVRSSQTMKHASLGLLGYR